MLGPLQTGTAGSPELFIVLFMTALPLVVALAIGALIYRDAKGRESNHALAWGLASVFGGLFVWILYAVVRDEVGGVGRTATGKA